MVHQSPLTRSQQPLNLEVSPSLSLLPSSSPSPLPPPPPPSLLTHLFSFSNRSAACEETNELEEALKDAMMCVQLKPDWVKVHKKKREGEEEEKKRRGEGKKEKKVEERIKCIHSGTFQEGESSFEDGKSI